MCMSVKILNRQSFHALKHFISKITQGSLAYINHKTVIHISTAYSNSIKTCHTQNCHCKGVKIRCLGLQKRHNVLVDQSLGKHGSLNIGKNTDHNSDHHSDNVDFIILKHICQKPSQHLPGILYHRAGTKSSAASSRTFYWFIIAHACSPPLFSSKSPPPFIWEL